MKIHHLTPEEVLASLRTCAAGISTSEARRRLREFGLNQVQRAQQQSVAWRFLKEFTHFFALILWVAAALAFWAESQDPHQGMAVLGRAMVGVIAINGLFSFWQVHRAYLFLGVLEAVAALAAYFFVLLSAGWEFGQEIPRNSPLYPVYLQATTACLAAIVIMQVVNVFLCRSDRKSLFSRSLFENRLILVGIGVELLLMFWISYTRAGNFIFGTAPLDGRVWVFVIPFALGMLLAEELRKAMVRIRSGTS